MPLSRLVLGGLALPLVTGGFAPAPAPPPGGPSSRLVLGGIAAPLVTGGLGRRPASPPPDDGGDSSRLVLGGLAIPLVTLGLDRQATQPLPPSPIRDWHVLAEMRRLLEAAGVSPVFVCDPLDWQPPRDVGDRVAFLYPKDWAEADTWGGDVESDRVVTYTLTLLVRDEEPERRVNRLDLMTQTAQNALNGVSYLGECVGPRCRVRSGRMVRVAHPWSCAALTGSFEYLIPGHDGHDEVDDIDALC